MSANDMSSDLPLDTSSAVPPLDDESIAPPAATGGGPVSVPPGWTPSAGVPQRTLTQKPRWPHPNFWWSILWCILFMIVTQIPGAVIAVVVIAALAVLSPERFPPGVLSDQAALMKSEPMGVGVGLVGTLFRLDLEGEGEPTRLIAKLAAPTDEGRFVATVLNMYGREVGFYTELSPHTPIAHPACYYAAHDPETQDAVLLLEDVSPRGTAFDQIAGCSLDDARPLIRTLAQLHARFWDDDLITTAPWLLRLADEPYPSAVAFAYDTAWPVAQQHYPELMTKQVKAFGDAYGARVPALFAKLCEGPHVLSHADWRIDNLFVAPDGEVIALDWQLIDRSVGPRDLSYLMTQSVNVSGPDDYRAAFDAYVDDLAEFGVAVDCDWAWEMFRYGTSFAFVYPVVAAGALEVNDPRHIELCRAMLTRSIAGLAALDAFDLPL